MGNRVIIRVPEGTVLSAELERAFQQRFPGYVLQPFSEQPDYKQAYAERINSLHAAFQYLLKAYPFPPSDKLSIEKEALEAYVKGCVDATHADMKDVSETNVPALQKILEKHTTNIIDAIALLWNIKGKEAAELLNEAEQYDIMGKGRPDLVTYSIIEGYGPILQVDEVLPPYNDLIIAELKQIKADGYPKTPVWFNELTEHSKYHFIHSYFAALDGRIELADVIKDFDTLLAKWDEVSKSELIYDDLARIAGKNPPFPRWFSNLSLPLQELFNVLAKESPSTVGKRLITFKAILSNPAYQSDLTQIIKIPQWYWVLPKHQQYFLEEALKNKPTVEEAVSFLSSRHRTLPMLANFAQHRTLKVTTSESGVIEFTPYYSSPKIRSSHVASRNGFKWPWAVQRRHVLDNLAKALEKAKPEQVVLFQTLISPIPEEYLPEFVANYLSKLFPDIKLEHIARSAVDARGAGAPELVKTNHPYNYYRLLGYATAENQESRAILIAAELLADTIPDLKPIIEDYKAVLSSSFGTATINDKVGREIFLSSLEQLLVLTMNGYSYGSCVSGKDRKAIELIHTDAMYLYKDIYNCWPKFNDSEENRANFISLVAEIYITRHQQEHSGQNARGAKGIKTPQNYFPADISAAIKTRLRNDNVLTYDDDIASNNEVREISVGKSYSFLTDTLLPKQIMQCNLVARQLGEDMCKSLYTKLSHLLNQGHLFTPMEASSSIRRLAQRLDPRFWQAPSAPNVPDVPTGIGRIIKFMADKHTGRSSVERMAGILAIGLERPSKDETRTTATLSVYNRLNALVESQTPEALDSVATETVAEWHALFEASKEKPIIKESDVSVEGFSL